jgi:hypothetical protein
MTGVGTLVWLSRPMRQVLRHRFAAIRVLWTLHQRQGWWLGRGAAQHSTAQHRTVLVLVLVLAPSRTRRLRSDGIWACFAGMLSFFCGGSLAY